MKRSTAGLILAAAGLAGVGAAAYYARSARGAQGAVQVTVDVTYGGQPVVGAAIEMGPSGGATSASGKAVLDVPPGSYVLTVTAGGYDVYNASVSVEYDGQVIPVSLSQAPPPPPTSCYDNVPFAVDITSSESLSFAWALRQDSAGNVYVAVLPEGTTSCPAACSGGDFSTATQSVLVSGRLVDAAGAPVCGVDVVAQFGQASVPWSSPDGLLAGTVDFSTAESGPVATDSSGIFGFIVGMKLTVTQKPYPGQETDGQFQALVPETVRWSVQGSPGVASLTALTVRGMVCFSNC